MDEVALAAELNARHGVTTRARLRRLGMSDRVITELVRVGRLRRVARGVFVSPVWPDTFERSVAIACAATGGVATFPTAGLLWGFRKTPRPPEVYVVVPWTRRVQPPQGVRVRRTRHLPATDVVRRRDGIDVLSPPRTAFEAAHWLSADDLESLVEQGIDRGMFIIPTLWRTSGVLARSGRDGSALFVKVIGAREPWRRAVESDYELQLERAMRARGFPALVRQPRLQLPDGRIIHPDLGIPEDSFYVEVDHLTWHGGRIETARDRWRDLKVRSHGYNVERVTDLAIDHHLEETIEDLWTAWQRTLGS